MVDQRLSDILGEGVIPAMVVDWEAITSLPADQEMDMEPNDLDPERTIGERSEPESDK